MIDKVKDFIKVQNLVKDIPDEKARPKHIVINLFPFSGDFEIIVELLQNIMEIQLEKQIPIVTVSLGDKANISDQKMLKDFCNSCLRKALEEKINITVFGMWYDLDGSLVESLKRINNETNDFDRFFFNLCINYEGKQEIINAVNLLLKKEDVKKVTMDKLRENLYTSYFVPPELIIEPTDKFSGTLLWNAAGSKIYNLDKKIAEIGKKDITKAIDEFSD